MAVCGKHDRASGTPVFMDIYTLGQKSSTEIRAIPADLTLVMKPLHALSIYRQRRSKSFQIATTVATFARAGKLKSIREHFLEEVILSCI